LCAGAAGAGAAGAGAGAGAPGAGAGAPGAGAGAPGAAGAGAAASFLAGSAGFFSGADGQPANVKVSATKKRMEIMIATSLLIDSYLPFKKILLTLVNQSISFTGGRYSIYFYLVKINLLQNFFLFIQIDKHDIGHNLSVCVIPFAPHKNYTDNTGKFISEKLLTQSTVRTFHLLLSRVMF